jgi:hypothetical protein
MRVVRTVRGDIDPSALGHAIEEAGRGADAR